MTIQSSATEPIATVLSPRRNGWGWALLGVLAFSLTVPLTRLAVGDLSALFVGAGRAVVAAAVAGVVLWATRQPWPSRRQWRRIALVAGGVVAAFPLGTAYALTNMSASHGAVVIALLPAVTAVVVAVRTGERPPRAFWLSALAGALVAVGFAQVQGGIGELHWADLLLFVSVFGAAIGYAEGGMLAREIGSWQAISWSLVAAAPAMVALTVLSFDSSVLTASWASWAAFAYLSLVSMYLGFFAWYRGLAIGPMATVSQVQLVQPVFTLLWAALLLGERIDLITVIAGAGVIGLAANTVLARGSSGTAQACEPGVVEPSAAAPRVGEPSIAAARVEHGAG